MKPTRNSPRTTVPTKVCSELRRLLPSEPCHKQVCNHSHSSNETSCCAPPMAHRCLFKQTLSTKQRTSAPLCPEGEPPSLTSGHDAPCTRPRRWLVAPTTLWSSEVLRCPYGRRCPGRSYCVWNLFSCAALKRQSNVRMEKHALPLARGHGTWFHTTTTTWRQTPQKDSVKTDQPIFKKQRTPFKPTSAWPWAVHSQRHHGGGVHLYLSVLAQSQGLVDITPDGQAFTQRRPRSLSALLHASFPNPATCTF